MLRSFWSALAVCGALFLATPAQAAWPEVYPMGQHGRWEVFFQADQPVTGRLDIEMYAPWVVDSIATSSMVAWGGGEYIAASYDFNSPVTFGKVFFYVPRSYQIFYDFYAVGPVVEGHTFAARADFYGGPGPVTVGYHYLGAIPEPMTWALMIAGFGMVGGALRLRSRDALAA